jgi:hypothetical protein
MEFLYTYAVSVAFTLYFGYALISGIENAVDNSLRGWIRDSRPLLVGLVCAVLAGLVGHYGFADYDTYEHWSLVLGSAVVCGVLSTLLAQWAHSKPDGDAHEPAATSSSRDESTPGRASTLGRDHPSSSG